MCNLNFTRNAGRSAAVRKLKSERWVLAFVQEGKHREKMPVTHDDDDNDDNNIHEILTQ